MKNISEKLTISGFLITAMLISIAYGLGGGILYSQMDLYRYYGTLILGFGIPAAQVLMALVRIVNHLPDEERNWWLILAVISLAIVVLFPIIFPKIC